MGPRAVRLFLVVAVLMTSSPGGTESPGSGSGGRDWSVQHSQMIRAIEADVTRNSHVLGRPHLSDPVTRALSRVPRHEFVPPELHSRAYANHPLPIGHGQTISQPTIVALMTDLMGLHPDDIVLEIGTGSGYQAAVLAEVVAEGTVHTIEIVPELAATARRRLAKLGYDNVIVHTGDGYLGLPDLAPFAAVMVTAAADEIPQPLVDQLAPGGRIVMPVGPQGATQWLTVIDKDADGAISERVVLPVRFVPLVRSRDED